MHDAMQIPVVRHWHETGFEVAPRLREFRESRAQADRGLYSQMEKGKSCDFNLVTVAFEELH